MQYTCPECGRVGGHPKSMKPPFCDRCIGRVVMMPSNNGKIINDHQLEIKEDIT